MFKESDQELIDQQHGSGAKEPERTYTDLPAQIQKKRLESWHTKPEAMKQRHYILYLEGKVKEYGKFPISKKRSIHSLPLLKRHA